MPFFQHPTCLLKRRSLMPSCRCRHFPQHCAAGVLDTVRRPKSCGWASYILQHLSTAFLHAVFAWPPVRRNPLCRGYRHDSALGVLWRCYLGVLQVTERFRRSAVLWIEGSLQGVHAMRIRARGFLCDGRRGLAASLYGRQWVRTAWCGFFLRNFPAQTTLTGSEVTLMKQVSFPDRSGSPQTLQAGILSPASTYASTLPVTQKESHQRGSILRPGGL